MLFFKWFRDCVRNAVLGGVQDALEHLSATAEKQAAEEPGAVLTGLQVTLALPGPAERKGKKQ